jgi:hypothetical protein
VGSQNKKFQILVQVDHVLEMELSRYWVAHAGEWWKCQPFIKQTGEISAEKPD